MSEHDLAVEMDGWSSGQFRLWITTLTEASAPTVINWWLRVRIMPQRRAYDRTLPAGTRREWTMVFLSLVEGSERFAGLDRWTDNVGLHRYYENRGFKHVRTLDLPHYPSGALFQRPATNWRADAESRLTAAKPEVLPTRRGRFEAVERTLWPVLNEVVI